MSHGIFLLLRMRSCGPVAGIRDARRFTLPVSDHRPRRAKRTPGSPGPLAAGSSHSRLGIAMICTTAKVQGYGRQLSIRDSFDIWINVRNGQNRALTHTWRRRRRFECVRRKNVPDPEPLRWPASIMSPSRIGMHAAAEKTGAANSYRVFRGGQVPFCFAAT
jgi:hypothetical protein